MNNKSTINWTEKVKKLCKDACDESGNDLPPENAKLLISITTLNSEAIEPAIIYNENDQFLDVFVLVPSEHGLATAAVLKDKIQSVSFIGHALKADDAEVKEVTESLNPSYI